MKGCRNGLTPRHAALAGLALASALSAIYLIEERALRRKRFDTAAFRDGGAPLEVGAERRWDLRVRRYLPVPSSPGAAPVARTPLGPARYTDAGLASGASRRPDATAQATGR